MSVCLYDWQFYLIFPHNLNLQIWYSLGINAQPQICGRKEKFTPGSFGVDQWQKKQSSGDPADIPNDENCLWHVLLYAHAVVSSGMILLWSCSGSENVILISPPQDISSDLKMYLEHNEEHLDLYLDLPFCRAITQDD